MIGIVGRSAELLRLLDRLAHEDLEIELDNEDGSPAKRKKASTEGSSDVGLSAAWSESPPGIESETKRAPPIFTKPRRVSVMVIRESLEFSVLAVIAIPPP
jgi:hypothetical protein